MGRPTHLTDELRDRICELIASPLPTSKAVTRAGLGASTHYRWMQYGDPDLEPGDDWPDDLEPYREYRDAIACARAEAMEKLLDPIMRRAEGGDVVRKDKHGNETRVEWDSDWRAAAWLAERMFPDDLGPRQKLDHTGISAPVAQVVNVTTPEAQDAAREFLRIASGT